MKPCQACPDAITAWDTLKAQAGRSICARLAGRPAKLVNDRDCYFYLSSYSSVFKALMYKLRIRSGWGFLENGGGGKKERGNENLYDILHGMNSIQDKSWPAENFSTFQKAGTTVQKGGQQDLVSSSAGWPQKTAQPNSKYSQPEPLKQASSCAR